MRYTGIALAAMLAAGMLVVGCGKSGEKVAEEVMDAAAGQDVKVDIDGEKVTFTDSEGELTVQAGKDVRLPDNFPSDVPVYDPGDVMHTAMRNENEFSISIQTSDPVGKVSAFYTSAMASKGWTAKPGMQMPGRSILPFEKDERNVTVMLAQDPKGVTVASIVGALSE